MKEFLELIDFLKEKGIQINSEYKIANERIVELSKKQVVKKVDNYFELISTAHIQDRIIRIIQYLDDLKQISKQYDNNVEISFDSILEKFLANKIDEIIKGKEIYNNEHPLFDYQPFFERLINAYAKNENYEKCTELRQFYGLIHIKK